MSQAAATLLACQAGAAGLLAGLALVVQLVVYPGFLTAGPLLSPQDWRLVHAAHSRRIGWAVAVPWAAQGVTDVWLSVLPATGVPRAWLFTAAVLGAGTVAVTVGLAVPLHRRLAEGFEAAAVRGLLGANLLRLGLWLAATALPLALLTGHIAGRG